MRRLISGSLLLFFLAVGVNAQTELNWVRVAPDGGGFVVMMPAKAEEQVDQKEKLIMHVFIAKLEKGIYLASYSDYVDGIQGAPQVELEADRDKFNKVLKAKLLTTRNITMDGRQGIEFTSETDSANIKSKVFIQGNRVFHQTAMIFKDVDQTKTVEAFFDSFAFTSKN